MEKMNGRRVRCVRGWRAIGLQRGGIYTVAVGLDSLFVSAESVGLPDGRHSPTGPRGASEITPTKSGVIAFKKPQVILDELAHPYLLDADRFVAA